MTSNGPTNSYIEIWLSRPMNMVKLMCHFRSLLLGRCSRNGFS